MPDMNNVKNTWPPEVLEALGSFPDFPELHSLRGKYGADAPREPLDDSAGICFDPLA